MKDYEVITKLSDGTLLPELAGSMDLGDLKKTILERLPRTKEYLSSTHPGKELEKIVIYELVEVAVINPSDS